MDRKLLLALGLWLRVLTDHPLTDRIIRKDHFVGVRVFDVGVGELEAAIVLERSCGRMVDVPTSVVMDHVVGVFDEQPLQVGFMGMGGHDGPAHVCRPVVHELGE